ncbi:MAG: hypothetical protein KQJ78_24060 [Deltaproteobacteria bacterium]|nr:hypothetical protein [Deltaproteobacteria bacterium]
MLQVTSDGPSHNLTAQCLWAGPDLLVLVTAGDAPHLGAVAAATPRPSLADPARTSATASVLTYLGHKEDALAKELAEHLAARLGVKVVVAAGAHWDGLDQAGIAQVGQNSRRLGQLILEHCGAQNSEESA